MKVNILTKSKANRISKIQKGHTEQLKCSQIHTSNYNQVQGNLLQIQQK